MLRLLSLPGWPAIPAAFAMHLRIAAGEAWEPVATCLALAFFYGPAAEHVG